MATNDTHKEAAHQSGNIWGWKLSFISFLIILITFIAIMLTGGLNTNKPDGSGTRVDSTLREGGN